MLRPAHSAHAWTEPGQATAWEIWGKHEQRNDAAQRRRIQSGRKDSKRNDWEAASEPRAAYLLYASAGIPRESRRTERAEAVPRPNCKGGFLQLGREKE
jgi:hypothetical protein